MIVTVRQAKTHLSRLLEQAAAGEEILITSDGKPKARLIGIGTPQVPFRVNWKLLRTPRHRPAGTLAEHLVRQDRDGRD